MNQEEYDSMMSLSPEERVREESGDYVYDRVSGILVAFSKRFEMRGGWLDLITIKDAQKEIRELIIDCVNDPKLLNER